MKEFDLRWQELQNFATSNGDCGLVTKAMVEGLSSIEKRLFRRAVRYCNEEMDEKTQKRLWRKDKENIELANLIVKELGITVEHQSDPRGYQLEIIAPTGARLFWGTR